MAQRSNYISAESLAAKINDALKAERYKLDECKAVVADDDRIVLVGKKASGEVSRTTNSNEPWTASEIKHMLLVRIMETIPEVK